MLRHCSLMLVESFSGSRMNPLPGNVLDNALQCGHAHQTRGVSTASQCTRWVRFPLLQQNAS
ncbi:hypothetical protein CEE69_26580 [Rhodopirellula bahusiensis]|uniref:Uncharacterized protein n=1 Tax=Rhodopirellula bahusiensis TaxID=2014065 RepID=A0A2G1W012_9BACT|nr:hypothetical protein CEE69_26580 [Rhodopirellula bahusiensis]